MLRTCGKNLLKLVTVRPSLTLVAGRNLGLLPRMPVPPLKQSCELYLGFLKTFLEPEELKRTTRLVEEFLKPGGVGERLQRGLERKARDTDNWLTDDFLKYEVLMKRKPLVMCLNFGILCTKKDISDKLGQLRCAAEFITSVLDIKTMVDNETLPVEYMRGKPQCMKQYEQVFASCRVPRLKMDSLVFYAKSSSPPRHISVVHKGQFFALDVYHGDGTLLTADELRVQLENICNSTPQANTEPVGILTTQQRDVWSRAYISLLQDETNKKSLLTIESSIFTLCLDGAMPPVSDEMKYRRRGLLQMLHGGGSRWYSGNRWFDKGLQIIIGEDGTRGLNCGHTVADGTVLMAICDYAVSNTDRETPHAMQAPRDPLPTPQELHFNITPEIRRDIEEAKRHMDTMVHNMDLTVTVFNHFGKNAIKAQKMSPDAFAQMAIQLAYYRVHNKCGAILEPVSLRMFRRGRLAIMPTHSEPSAAFIKAFSDPKQQNVEKVFLLGKAMKEHRKRTEMVLSGQAVATHFIGLVAQASEQSIPLPDLFTDSTYTQGFDVYQVTTSQVTSRAGSLLCNSLDQPGMYDVDYSIMDNHIDCRVTSLEASSTSREKQTAELSRALQEALLDMMTLVEETPGVEL